MLFDVKVVVKVVVLAVMKVVVHVILDILRNIQLMYNGRRSGWPLLLT